MPFAPGEQVNLRFEGNQDTARLVAGGAEFTVANGGLRAMRDGGLVAIVQLPMVGPAVVDYEFADGEHVEIGKLRVISEQGHRALPNRDVAVGDPGTVKPRQYTGR